MIAHGGRPGDAHAGGHHAVLADPVVVPELNLVVELRPFAHDRVVQSAAVDRGVGAHFDVVAEHRTADLRDFDPFAAERRKAETVAPQNGARLHDASVAQDRTRFEDGVGVNEALGADLHVFAHIGARAHDGARTDSGTALHDGQSFNGGRRIDLGPLFDVGTRVNARGRGDGEKKLRREGKEGVGVFAKKHRARRAALRAEDRFTVLFAKDDERRRGRLYSVRVTRVRQKGHVARTRRLRGHEALDDDVLARETRVEPSLRAFAYERDEFGGEIGRLLLNGHCRTPWHPGFRAHGQSKKPRERSARHFVLLGDLATRAAF